MNIEVVEVRDEVDAEDMPMCPLCGQPISAGEPVSIGNADMALALIHADCGEEVEARDEEE